MSKPPLFSFLPFERFRNPPPLVSVVRLNGLIGGMGAFRQGLSLASLAGTLNRAFQMRGVTAVALVINSPGGSPVQSALIAKRIRALAEEEGVPVVAFAEDVAASGGYWLATAADEIYADVNSVIGSIGVIAGSFGFPELLKRIGVERRVRTAGEFKAALDPFREEKPAEVAHLEAFLEDVHESFRDHVRKRRGGKLSGDEEMLFSGRWWSGRKALELGLIDGLGDLRSVMRDRYGKEVRLRVVGGHGLWWRRWFGRTRRFSGESAAAEMTTQALAAIEERLTWARFGL